CSLTGHPRRPPSNPVHSPPSGNPRISSNCWLWQTPTNHRPHKLFFPVRLCPLSER
ncbi:hypothetical protein PspLS_05676, partial [Pyricularia sp. CBS 133598]